MAEVVKDVAETTKEEIKDLADTAAEKIQDAAETTAPNAKELAEARPEKIVADRKLQHLRKTRNKLMNVNPAFVEPEQLAGLRGEPPSDSDSSTGESGTDTLNFTGVAPEKPSGGSADSNVTTAKSSSALPTEQAHVENLTNSPAQFPQATMYEKSDFSPKPENSNIEVTAEKSELKSKDSRDPIAEKPNLVPAVEASPVKSKSENSALIESSPKKSASSVGSVQQRNSGDTSSVRTLKYSAEAAVTAAALVNMVFSHSSELDKAQIETRLQVEKESVEESPENLAESKIA